MYISVHHIDHEPVRAYRVKGDSDLWVQLTSLSKISLTLAEAEKLIAELSRELSAAKAEVRGVAA